jgi:hypothetical protein
MLGRSDQGVRAILLMREMKTVYQTLVENHEG